MTSPVIRAVLDTNVLVAAALSRTGAPATLLLEWIEGAFELVTSPLLLKETRRVFAYPKIAQRIASADRDEFLALIEETAEVVDDPNSPPRIRSRDPQDDYLIALAAAAPAVLVTGDEDLLSLSERIPVFAPSAFLAFLRRPDSEWR